IAVFNERRTIAEIIDKVYSVPMDLEIVAVDDGSQDGTVDILKEISKKYPAEKLRVHYHSINQGKGAAIRTAIADAKGQIAIIQDADLEYDPREYPKLLQPVLEGKADVVYGSRFLGGPHRVLFFWHY